MTDRCLLARQVSLLAHLTSGPAIFGGPAPRDPLLRGFDTALLRLEAKYSYEKRIGKIRNVLPRTFDSLGNAEDRILRAFVQACPPTTPGSLENAGQFCGFLRMRRNRAPPVPAHVPDIAACEFAIARVWTWARDAAPEEDADVPRPAIRRHPGIVLMCCAYDIRQVFENGPAGEVARRETGLAVAVPPGEDRPQVIEVLPAIFSMLAALDRWTEPAALGAAPTLDGLFSVLAARGLLEVRS